MRTTPVRLAAILAAGMIAAALAGCAESGGSGGPGQQAEAVATAPSPTPTASMVPASAVQLATVTGGDTRIALGTAFQAALRSEDVTASASGAAELRKHVLTLPVTGGAVSSWGVPSASAPMQGVVLHQGAGLTLHGSDRVVTLTDLVLQAGATPMVTGTVKVDGASRGSHVDLFGVDTSTAQPTRTPDGETGLTGITLTETSVVARLLGDVFGGSAADGSSSGPSASAAPAAFSAGAVVGTAQTVLR